MRRAICRIAKATSRPVRPPVTTAHKSTSLLSSARAWSRSFASRSLSTSGNDDDANARATDDYAPADAAPDDTARAWVAWEDKDAAGAWRPAACNAYVRVDLAGMW